MTSNTIQMAATAGGEALAYEAVAGELIAAQNELVQSMMSAESAKQNAMRTRETLKREEAKLLATGEIPGKNQPETRRQPAPATTQGVRQHARR